MSERPDFLRAGGSRRADGEESESSAAPISAAPSKGSSATAPSDPTHGCVDWYEYEDDDADD